MSQPSTSMLLPFLQKLEWRSSLTDQERRAILALPFTTQCIGANRNFVRKGEPIHHCCFLLDGVVGAYEQSRAGERQIVAIYISGDMIDLSGVALQGAMSALEALSPTTILRVPHSALLKLGRDFPNIFDAFWRECAADTGILREWIVNVGRRNARTRMAHFFCELACRWERETPVDGTRIPYAITQQQLSEILSLTPVHVNRTLQGLRHDGLLDTLERAVMRIFDWKRLVSIGDFDAGYLGLEAAEAKRNPFEPAPFWQRAATAR